MVNRQYSLFSNNSIDQKNINFPIRGSPYVVRFKIHKITIPLSYNTTDSSNNSFTFERNGSVKTATLPPGNYTAATFPQALQDVLNAVSTVRDFAVSFDTTSRKMTINAGSAFTVRPFSGGTTLYRQLGMGKFQTQASGLSVTFGIPDFTNSAPLLLTSTSLSSKHMVYAGDENINVLAMIDTNAPQGSVAKWVNQGGYVECGAEMPNVDSRILNASTMFPVELSQPFSVTLSILSDEDDSKTMEFDGNEEIGDNEQNGQTTEAALVKKRRTITPEARKKMRENLEKAREARAANKAAGVTNFSKAKRVRAQEMYEEHVDKKAEEKARILAEKMLQEKEKEKELEELRKWKSASEKEAKMKETESTESTKKKAAPKKPTASAKNVKNTSGSQAAPKKRVTMKAAPPAESDEEQMVTY
ncbi:hypothetical protein HDV00_012576 [Rhizophlyctis rosea]|nr:hypothetical protein HDV00_012576 [Rhizophlyctis rosea]